MKVFEASLRIDMTGQMADLKGRSVFLVGARW